MEVQIINEDTKTVVPVRIIDNEDYTFSVELTPPLTGTYTTNLTYGGLKVPTPKKTVIKPAVDVSKIQVEGLESSKKPEILFES